jgi:hypothetical protein
VAAAAVAVVAVVMIVAAVVVVVVIAAVAETAAAVAVVAAEKHTHQRPLPVNAPASTEQAEPQVPAVLAEGTQPSPKVSPPLAEGTSPDAQAFRAPPELVARATSVGEAWCQEYVRELRAQSRDIVGGWPGTLREARRRVLAYMPRTIEPLLLDELARITNLAARRGWESVSEPDLEP